MTVRTKLVAAGALVLALAGAGAAVGGASLGKGPGRTGLRPLHPAGIAAALRGPGLRVGGPVVLLDRAAEYLGIPAATLRDELRSGKTLAQVANATSGKSADGLVAALLADAQQRLDAAVQAGRLTRSEADNFLGRLREGIRSMVEGTRPAWPLLPHPGLRHVVAGELQAAADYLGIPVATLRDDLRSGKTLAQEAQAAGKPVAGLVQALLAQAKTELAAAVKAGRLTQAQADAIGATLEQRVADRVDGVRPGMRPYGPGLPGMHPGWGEPPGQGNA